MGRALHITIGVLLAVFVQGIVTSAAHPSGPGHSAQELRFHFRFDRSLLDSAYRDNQQSIRELRECFADPSSAFRVDSISVSASSSMEGYGWHNDRLTRDRAQAVKGYLIWKYPLLNQYRIHTHSLGEDWEGLYGLLLSSPDVPCRNQILRLFEEGRRKEEIDERLRSLSDGLPYRYLQQNLFPLLRCATVRIFWKDTTLYAGSSTGPSPEEVAEILASPQPKEEPPSAGYSIPSATQTQQPAAAPAVTAETASQTGQERQAASTPESTGRWAIKTNLLYWAALAPNLEAEIYMGRRWSVNLEAQCAWWSQPQQHRYYQLLSGGPEVRFRFAGRDRFHGHYFGLYGSAGMYDLENRKTGYQGEFYSAGLTYGYLLPIGRALGLEFGLGAGFVTSRYKTYVPQDGLYVYQRTRRMQYTGLTKAKVSLLWRFGSKGGRR